MFTFDVKFISPDGSFNHTKLNASSAIEACEYTSDVKQGVVYELSCEDKDGIRDTFLGAVSDKLSIAEQSRLLRDITIGNFQSSLVREFQQKYPDGVVITAPGYAFPGYSLTLVAGARAMDRDEKEASGAEFQLCFVLRYESLSSNLAPLEPRMYFSAFDQANITRGLEEFVCHQQAEWVQKNRKVNQVRAMRLE